MDELRALSSYTKVCDVLLTMDENRPQTWNRLHRRLLVLQELLKCRACFLIPNFANGCYVCARQLFDENGIPFLTIKSSRDLCRVIRFSGAYAVMVSRPEDAALVELIDQICLSPLTGDSDVSSEGANEGLESSENASGFAEDGSVCSEDSRGSYGGADSEMSEETTDNAELPVAGFEQDYSLDGRADGYPGDDLEDDYDTMTQSTGEETANDTEEPTKTDVISCRCGSRLKKYSLKGVCVTRRCSCVKNQRKCGEVCRCKNCKN